MGVEIEVSAFVDFLINYNNIDKCVIIRVSMEASAGFGRLTYARLLFPWWLMEAAAYDDGFHME